MAHFAEIKQVTDPTGHTADTLWIVQRVCVVGNNTETVAGPLGENDMHIDGETWCQNFWGGTWKQTSYNHNFRKQYCGNGFVYDSTKDKFLEPQPHKSWSLDENDNWKPPVDWPTIFEYGEAGNKKQYLIEWDEENLKWTAKDSEDPQNSFNWDPSGLAWVSA